MSRPARLGAALMRARRGFLWLDREFEDALLSTVTVRMMLGDEFFCRCAEPDEKRVYRPRRTTVVLEGARLIRWLGAVPECGACGRPLYHEAWDKPTAEPDAPRWLRPWLAP